MAAAEGVRWAGASRHGLTGQLVLGGILVGAAVANGGYFPSSWGWIALASLWVAALASGRAMLAHRGTTLMVGSLGAFVAWTWAGAAWGTPTLAAREGESVLVLLAGTMATFAVVRRSTILTAMTIWVLVIAGVSAYSLVTRLFPNGNLDIEPIGGYRLTRPVGYWNSLGLFAAVGLALAAGLAARGTPARRAVAAATVPILATTVYFTYSRGAAIALAVGLVVTFALDPNRGQWFITSGVLAVPAAVAVAFASGSGALTTAGARVSEAASQGHRLAVVVVALSVLIAVLAWLRPVPELSTGVNGAVTILVGVLLVAAIVGGVVVAGGPTAIKNKFTAPPPATHGQLNKRLFSFSGSYRAPLWSQAVHEYDAHPVLGGGPGTYETYYLQHRTRPDKVRNAHSLYLETLAEVGPIGLALLILALGTPLVVAVVARRRPFVSILAGAYVAFLVHLAVDWDWQVTGIALMGLCCGAGVVIGGRAEDDLPEARPAARRVAFAGLVVLIAVAFVVLVGNLSMSRASAAASTGNWAASARDARRAHTWAPWSSEPYRLLGEAQLGQGDTAAAIASFRKAIEKSPGDWNIWFDLARATTGAEQQVALRHAVRLNPLSPEIVELRREISADSTITVTAK